MMKLKTLIIAGIFLSCLPSLISAQYLSIYRPVIGPPKYMIDMEKVKKKEFVQQISKRRKSKEFYLNSKRQNLYSNLLNAGQWLCVGLQINEAFFDNDSDPGMYYLIPNLIFGIASGYFRGRSRFSLEQSLYYNNINNFTDRNFHQQNHFQNNFISIKVAF